MFNNIFGSLPLALTFVQPFDNVIMILSGIFLNIRSMNNFVIFKPNENRVVYNTEIPDGA